MPCKHFSSASLPNHQQFIYSCFAFGLLALRKNVAACEKSGKDFASFLWLAWGAVINLSPRAKQVFEVVVQGLVQTFFFFNWVIFRFYVALQRCKYTSRYFETKFFIGQNIYTNRCICFLKLYVFGIYFLIVPMYFCVFHSFSLFIFCLSICFLACFIDLFVFCKKSWSSRTSFSYFTITIPLLKHIEIFSCFFFISRPTITLLSANSGTWGTHS